MSPPLVVDLLAIVIVSGLQADRLMKRMRQEGFAYTKIDSSGGVLMEPVYCLLVGLDRNRLDALSGLVRECCQPFSQYIPTQMSDAAGYAPMPILEARVGGATIYAMNVERFEQF